MKPHQLKGVSWFATILALVGLGGSLHGEIVPGAKCELTYPGAGYPCWVPPPTTAPCRSCFNIPCGKFGSPTGPWHCVTSTKFAEATLLGHCSNCGGVDCEQAEVNCVYEWECAPLWVAEEDYMCVWAVAGPTDSTTGCIHEEDHSECEGGGNES